MWLFYRIYSFLSCETISGYSHTIQWKYEAQAAIVLMKSTLNRAYFAYGRRQNRGQTKISLR